MASKMALWVKVFATKLNDLILILQNHTVKAEN